MPISTPLKEKSGAAAFVAGANRHALLFADYFTQYAKVRIGYRGDFIVSLLTSFAATIFQIAFVIVLFEKAPQLGGWRFEEVLFLIRVRACSLRTLQCGQHESL